MQTLTFHLKREEKDESMEVTRIHIELNCRYLLRDLRFKNL